MSVIDDACQRLQYHALSSSDVTIKAAPDYPIENASSLPMAIAHLANGSAQADDADTTRMLIYINVDIHFSRVSIVDAYKKINLVAPEYLKRLGGDPTLGGAVDTIVYPVTFEVIPMIYNTIPTQVLRFAVQIKARTGVL